MKGNLENASNDHNYSIIDIDTNELIGDCGFLLHHIFTALQNLRFRLSGL
jgi:hypothetical protein